MEPERSLPHSQVHATCLYPEPAQSSPYPTSYFILLNIILPSMPGSPQCSLFLRFPHQNPVHASPLPLPSYMPRPSHSSRFYYPHNSGWGVQIIKLLIMKSSPLPCYLVPLRPKYFPHQKWLKLKNRLIKISTVQRRLYSNVKLSSDRYFLVVNI
jgi:hypothetical protein